jgi:hypothetical protein
MNHNVPFLYPRPAPATHVRLVPTPILYRDNMNLPALTQRHRKSTIFGTFGTRPIPAVALSTASHRACNASHRSYSVVGSSFITGSPCRRQIPAIVFFVTPNRPATAA